ncbi:MAG: RNA methyltransferase [Clostridia bacterium]|nr:RNA methyltransferase [Clostridia bacterium]
MKEADKQRASGIFEGMTSIRAVLAAIEAGESDRRIVRILFDETRARARGRELSYLKAMSCKYGFPLEPAAPEVIGDMALGTTHGGLLLEATERTIPPLTADAVRRDLPEKPFFAMLEGIEDPYNFGYAIRSLYAAGVDAVVLSPRNWMSAAGVVCRASAGASERCRMYLAESAACAAVMRELGVKIVCCDMDNSVSMYDADLTRPIFLAVGGEKRGLSRELLSAADTVIRLDYGRDFPAALSAASAATIAGYEVFRQNREV